MSLTLDAVALERTEWMPLATAHAERADALTAAHRARASRAEKHPVEDFLFTYYSYKPAILRRWHPGVGVVLRDAPERAAWRWYRAAGDGVTEDATAFRSEKGSMFRGILNLLRATAARPASFGCFGLHEWAMAYRSDEVRHPVPLRLGREGTDAVVDAHQLTCTHFDAFRFFTPEAVPLNRTPLSRDDQVRREQPGCLHAGMDVYNGKLGACKLRSTSGSRWTTPRASRTRRSVASATRWRGAGPLTRRTSLWTTRSARPSLATPRPGASF